MKSGVLYGILLLAHGGAPRWNAQVESIRKAVDVQRPTEDALGMADGEEIQAAIDRLEERGAKEIVVVPLFINSASEVLDQTRFLLGLRKEPSQTLRDALAALPPEEHARMMAMEGHHPMFSNHRVVVKVPIVMTPALDDSPTMTALLLARAKALSKDPRHETVVLVAHGPVDDDANRVWLSTMRRLGRRIKAKGGFADVASATIRDDSPPEVKDKAIESLRRLVGGVNGRALVVPVLIARGGIEDHIIQALTDIPYAWDGATICPDPSVAGWVARSADRAARRGLKR